MQRTIRHLSVFIALFTLALSLVGSTALAQDAQQNKAPEERSHVDIVIALDTSNSMDGLIDSARQKLWDIVNDLATAKPTPILRVGVVSFGNDGYAESGWTRIDVPLTDDLDTVHERLMGLKTNGGNEYVGRAIAVSLDKMSWSQEKQALKMIFVAGNESADQDPEFRSIEQAARAIRGDVIVNTIFCGNDTGAIPQGWQAVAQRADGQFAAIAEDGGAVVVNTPYDQRLQELSSELNGTYVAYGSKGKEKAARQAAADRSASGLSGGAGAGRAVAKSSKLYRNSDWDLLDAQEEGMAVDKLEADELPAEMQKMTPKEREAHLAKLRTRRESIQKEIGELNVKRQAYIDAENKKNASEGDKAFDVAVKKAVRKQAARKKISF